MRDHILVHLEATAPAECDWRTAEMCVELTMLGMVRVVRDEDGVWTADIGHIIEEAISNLYPDAEIDPYKAAARRVYEEWLAEEELRQLEEEDPGFAEYLKQSHEEAFALLRSYMRHTS